MGRWIRQPLLDVAAITKRQNVVQAFADDPIARDSLREQLKASRNSIFIFRTKISATVRGCTAPCCPGSKIACCSVFWLGKFLQKNSTCLKHSFCDIKSVQLYILHPSLFVVRSIIISGMHLGTPDRTNLGQNNSVMRAPIRRVPRLVGEG